MMTEVKTNLESTSLNDNKQKIKKIEYTMNRDRKAFEILYKIIMTGMTKNETNNSVITNETDIFNSSKQNMSSVTEIFDSLDLQEYLSGLEKRVEDHLLQMKQSTDKMSEFVLGFFENVVKGPQSKKSEEKPIPNKESKKSKVDPKLPLIADTNQIDTSNFFMNQAMYPFMYNPYNNWPFIAANVRFD